MFILFIYIECTPEQYCILTWLLFYLFLLVLQVIRFSVWDKDPTESELIGQVVERFNRLDRLPGCASDVQWYNMYGAPEFKNDKLLSNLKKGAVAVAKAAQQTFAGEIDWTVSAVSVWSTLHNMC